MGIYFILTGIKQCYIGVFLKADENSNRVMSFYSNATETWANLVLLTDTLSALGVQWALSNGSTKDSNKYINVHTDIQIK